MFIDFKKTTWDRVHIPLGEEEETLKKLRNGDIFTPDDVLENPEDLVIEYDMMDNDDYLLPEENGNEETIAAFTEEDDGEEDIGEIWSNRNTGKMKEKRIYVIDSEKTCCTNLYPNDPTFNKKAFKGESEKQGNVYSLEGFIKAFNSEEINTNTDLIFIDDE